MWVECLFHTNEVEQGKVRAEYRGSESVWIVVELVWCQGVQAEEWNPGVESGTVRLMEWYGVDADCRRSLLLSDAVFYLDIL